MAHGGSQGGSQGGYFGAAYAREQGASGREEKGEKEDGGNAIVWFSLANSEIIYFRETPTTILVENPSSFKLLLKFSDSADVEKALFAISFR